MHVFLHYRDSVGESRGHLTILKKVNQVRFASFLERGQCVHVPLRDPGIQFHLDLSDLHQEETQQITAAA